MVTAVQCQQLSACVLDTWRNRLKAEISIKRTILLAVPSNRHPPGGHTLINRQGVATDGLNAESDAKAE
jgi:hypothetical protein